MVTMTSESVSDARQACEGAFSFLVDEFGYRRCRRRFQWGGFELAYCGPVTGVLIEWYPRDSLTVWLVKLVHGKLAPREKEVISPSSQLHYFDLGDIAAVRGQIVSLSRDQLHRLPDDEVAAILARILRQCGTELLNGDLSMIPVLEQRIKDRAREGFIQRFGPAEARRVGWVV